MHMPLSLDHPFVCIQISDFQAQANFSWTQMILPDSLPLILLIIAQHSAPADLPFSLSVSYCQGGSRECCLGRPPCIFLAVF